jgi:ATP-dependent protease HslVU (ClpYQ) ATPase subunit
MFEVFTDELFGQIDIDEFVKNEIESKAIVVIDEIDKLVRSVSFHHNFFFLTKQFSIK